jgi:hypothetical protein
MKITFGFEDLPYNKGASYRETGTSHPRRLRGGNMTTGELQRILEEHYHIVQFYWDNHGMEVVEDLVEGYLAEITKPASGKGSRTHYMDKAITRGQDTFRAMLDNRELDGLVAGVPTAAAQSGHSIAKRRRKRGTIRKERASFVETGLYRDSFRIQVEEE